ncbi:MAG TPA: hypothetical protein VGE01_05930 [Fimbriimonas sp.]
MPVRIARLLPLILLCVPFYSSAQEVTLTKVAFDRNVLLPYEEATGTVVVEFPVETATRINLRSSEPVLEMPAFVKILAGSRMAAFQVKALAVTSSTTTKVAATYSGQSVKASLAVQPSSAPMIVPTHPWVVGGSLTWASIELFQIAPAGGVTVKLASSEPVAVPVPSEVIVPEGASSARIEVQTGPVTRNIAAVVTGRALGTTFSANLNVRRPLVGAGWHVVGTNPNPLSIGGRTPKEILGGSTVATTVTSRTLHAAALGGRTETRRIRLVYANYDTQDGEGERRPPNPIWIKAGIEKIYGDNLEAQATWPTPVSFNQKWAAKIMPGEYVVSDPVWVTLREGERFFVRTTQQVATPDAQMCGGLSTLGGTRFGGFGTGEGLAVGDYAFGGTIPSGNFNGVYSPSAILGYTSDLTGSLAICGDSVLSGAGDGGFRMGAGSYGARVATRQFGLVQDHSIPPICGYVHLTRSAERVDQFLESAIRFELSCLSDIVLTSNLNSDLSYYSANRSTEEVLKAKLVELVRRWLVRGKRVVVATCNPRTSSVDGYFSAEGQATRDTEGVRLRMNQWLRNPDGFLAAVGASPGRVLVWDVCGPVEVDSTGQPSRSGGRWRAAPKIVDQGSVSGEAFLFSSSIQDRDRNWTGNALAGHALTFSTGANAFRTRSIAYSDDRGRVALRGGFASVPAVGDRFYVTDGVYTTDGTHPTSAGHALIARTFPFLQVFGRTP